MKIHDILKNITDASVQEARAQLLDFFNQALNEQHRFAKEMTGLTIQVFDEYARGERNALHLEDGLRQIQLAIEQNIITVEIESRARVQKILTGLLDAAIKCAIKLVLV